MNNSELCRSAICLAQGILGKDNLLVAFIAGSRAKGNYNQNSDIDLFVVLNHPSREKEKCLAEELKNLHEKQELMYEHCGEIFSQATLEKLLKGIGSLDALIENGFSQFACYQTDCILSIARKTQVVLHMLSKEKKMIVGDYSVLQEYEMIAQDFYSKHGAPLAQLHPQKLRWPNDNTSHDVKMKWQSYVDDIDIRKFCDTPLGIGLERWFLSNTFSDESSNILPIKSPQAFSALSSVQCPLWNVSVDKDMSRLLQSQCLGVSQNV